MGKLGAKLQLLGKQQEETKVAKVEPNQNRQ